MRIGWLLGVILVLAGCTATTAVPSEHGKAYVVSGNVFGTTMYTCDASGYQPECWPVREKELEE